MIDKVVDSERKSAEELLTRSAQELALAFDQEVLSTIQTLEALAEGKPQRQEEGSGGGARVVGQDEGAGAVADSIPQKFQPIAPQLNHPHKYRQAGRNPPATPPPQSPDPER